MSEFKNTSFDPVFPNEIMEDHTQIERAPGTDDIIAEARDYNILNTELIRTQQYIGLDPAGDWTTGSGTLFDKINEFLLTGASATWLAPSGSCVDLTVKVLSGVYYIDASGAAECLESSGFSDPLTVPASGAGEQYALLHIDKDQLFDWTYGTPGVTPSRPNTPSDVMPISMVGPFDFSTTNLCGISKDVRPFLNLGGQGSGNIGSLTTTVKICLDTMEAFTAVGGEVLHALTGFTYTPGASELRVYRSGVMQHVSFGDYTEDSDTVIGFASKPLIAGEEIIIEYACGSSTVTAGFELTGGYLKETFIPVGSPQSVFNLTLFDYVPGQNELSIHIDGIKQCADAGDYSEDSTTQFTMTPPVGVGELVTVELVVVGTGTPAKLNNAKETQIAADGQTVVNLSTMAYIPGNDALKVYIGGIRQCLGFGDYTEDSPTRITMATPLVLGEEILLERADVTGGGSGAGGAVIVTDCEDETIQGNGGAVYTFSADWVDGTEALYVDGVLQIRGQHYTKTGAAEIAFTTLLPTAADNLTIKRCGYVLQSGSVFTLSDVGGISNAFFVDDTVPGDGTSGPYTFSFDWIDGQESLVLDGLKLVRAIDYTKTGFGEITFVTLTPLASSRINVTKVDVTA